MFNAKISLLWPDGGRAAAALQAESAEADYPVKYSGDVDRMAGAPGEAGFAFLSFKLRQLATATGATYSEKISGTYDRQAGGRAGL